MIIVVYKDTKYKLWGYFNDIYHDISKQTLNLTGYLDNEDNSYLLSFGIQNLDFKNSNVLVAKLALVKSGFPIMYLSPFDKDFDELTMVKISNQYYDFNDLDAKYINYELLKKMIGL